MNGEMNGLRGAKLAIIAITLVVIIVGASFMGVALTHVHQGSTSKVTQTTSKSSNNSSYSSGSGSNGSGYNGYGGSGGYY